MKFPLPLVDNASKRQAQVESLRSMEELFGRQGGTFSRLIRDDLGRLADRVEYENADLDTILWERLHGETL